MDDLPQDKPIGEGKRLVAVRPPKPNYIDQVGINKKGDLVLVRVDGTKEIVGKVVHPGIIDARIMTDGRLVLKLSNGNPLIVGRVLAKDGIDGSGFIWRGGFQQGAIYYGQSDNPDGPVADVIEFEGSSFVCTGRTIAPPPSGSWDLMAKRGQDGGVPSLYFGGGGGGGSGGNGGGGEVDLSAYVRKDGTTPFTGQQTVPNGTTAPKAVNKGQLDAAISGLVIPAPSGSPPLAPSAAAPGTSTNYARADHVHPQQAVPGASNTDPLADGFAAPGTSVAYSRSDHVHPAAPPVDLSGYVKADGTVPFTGQITVPNGTTAPKAVNKGQLDAAIAGLPAGPAPSNTSPVAPTSGGTAGFDTTYARGDHAHPQQDLTPYVKADGSVPFTGQITVPNASTPTKAVNKGQLDVVSGAANDAGAAATLALSNASAAQITADAAMPKTGGTFTGAVFGLDATTSAHLVTKQQLDVKQDVILPAGWAGTGSVSRTVPNKLGETVSVKDYGAIGNGVADDSAAIQLALNVCPIVYLPPGTYLVGTTLTMSLPGQRFIGFGGTLRRKATLVNADVLQVLAARCYVEGINCDNPSLVASATGTREHCIAVLADGCKVIENTIVNELHSIAVRSSGEFYDTVISGNHCLDCLGVGPGTGTGTAGEDRGDGITCWGSRVVISGNLVTCKSGSDARIGIHVEGLQAFSPGTIDDRMASVSGNLVYGSFRRGVVTENVPIASITGNTVDGATWWAFAAIADIVQITGNIGIAAGNKNAPVGTNWSPFLNICNVHPALSYKNVNISNNTFLSKGQMRRGIGVTDVAPNEVQNVLIANNTIGLYDTLEDVGGYTLDFGIDVAYPRNCKIIGNQVSNTADKWLHIYRGGRCEVENNTAYNCAGRAHFECSGGSSTDIRFDHNTCQITAGTYAVEVQSVTRFTARGNNLDGNSVLTHCYRLFSCTDWLIPRDQLHTGFTNGFLSLSGTGAPRDWVTVTSGASPNVFNRETLVLNYAAPVTITDFAAMDEYQKILVIFESGNITVDFTGTVLKRDGTDADWTPTAGSWMRVHRYNNIKYCECHDEVVDVGAIPATVAPLAPAVSPAVGVATKYAREDHVHPDIIAAGALATSSVQRTRIAKFQEEISVKDFGAIGNGVADDSAAFALAAASGRKVLVPTGTYLCNSAAHTGAHVPGSSLYGDSIGKVRQAATDRGATIVWAGSGPWWQMTKVSPSSGAEGGHKFENITFKVTHPDGILFDWVSDTSNILRNVKYEQCIFLGPNLPGLTRSAIAIRAYCLFELTTDDQCFFYAFARALKLDSCDNITLDGKWQTNTQHVALFATESSFGNHIKIGGTLISTGSIGTDELGNPLEFCHVYVDDCNDLTLDNTEFENADGLGFLYWNGKNLKGTDIEFGNNTGEIWCTLGPNGKDATFTTPHFEDGGAPYPIVSEPWAQQSSSSIPPFTLTLVAPNEVWHERGDITGALGRVRVVIPARPEKSLMPAQNAQIGARGVGMQRFLYSPLDLQYGTIPSGSPALVESDVNAFSGLTWKLLKNSPFSGLRMRLKVGWHVENGDSLLILVRHKAAGTVSSGTLRYSVQLNGSDATNGAMLAGTTSYISDSRAYVLAGAAAGDSLDVGVYTDTGSVDQDCYVEAIEVVVVPSMHSDFGAPADLTNAAVSLSWGNTSQVQRLNVVLTANRTITLNTNTVVPGSRFRFYRTLAATGNFLLRIGSPTLINLSPGDWCEVRYSGSAWELIASGTNWLTTQTAAAQDATPSVLGMRTLITANASPTTITGLDDGAEGQEVLLLVNDANTTIDFTSTTLKGNAGVDWTPANGDFMRCRKIGTNWLCSVTDATA